MKRYPFSVQKHAHSIEFRYNRVKNALDEYYMGELNLTREQVDNLEELCTQLQELHEEMFNSRDGRVIYLTGEQIALAKQTVLWASNTRAKSMIAAGKYQYLQYC